VSAVWRGGGGAHFIGPGGGGEEARRPAAMEYYSPSVLNELRGRGGGATSFQWGSDGGRAAPWFGSPRAEEGAARGGTQCSNAGRPGGWRRLGREVGDEPGDGPNGPVGRMGRLGSWAG
jgi:hypothetical protein